MGFWGFGVLELEIVHDTIPIITHASYSLIFPHRFHSLRLSIRTASLTKTDTLSTHIHPKSHRSSNLSLSIPEPFKARDSARKDSTVMTVTLLHIISTSSVAFTGCCDKWLTVVKFDVDFAQLLVLVHLYCTDFYPIYQAPGLR